MQPEPTIDLIEWVRFAVSLTVPFIALGGGIWLFFLKRSAERVDQARDERKSLYRSYLEDLKNAEKDAKTVKTLSVAGAAMKHQELFAVLAPDSVYTATHHFIRASVLNAFDAEPKRDEHGLQKNPQPQSYIEAVEKIRAAKVNMLNAMRADVLEGTKVKVDLPTTEELNK
ncbi:hypothetical protein [uncultured Aliiroseovarius sp.]|uniref:hypothetical protein n=1 Tax=uncultured Aliiroseovarius sp. TaxID=1658783 RepID=UPI0026032750|nr:hypothetical protein [uncultured Aliiroseovarius sp.]